MFEGYKTSTAGTIIKLNDDTIVIEGGIFPLNEQDTGYDTSSGGPYDRGSADSYYGRKFSPHKIVDDPDSSVKGARKRVPLTDPSEIAAYEAGYRENDDKKDYGYDDKLEEAEYKGRKVSLGKPKRTPSGPKKFTVFVKNPKTGNVKKVNFGDKNMEIKRDDPERRASFRARHKCDTAKDRTSARYWSCRFWSKKPVSKLT